MIEFQIPNRKKQNEDDVCVICLGNDTDRQILNNTKPDDIQMVHYHQECALKLVDNN